MAVLLLLVTLIAPSLAQSFFPSCPTPADPCDFDDVDAFTTSYINVVANNAKTRNLDNACHTYFPIKDKYCSHLVYLTCVYSDGSVDTLSFIVTTNATNVLYFYSPTCSFEEVGLTSENQVEIIVRRVISGDCSDIIYPVMVSYPCLGYGTTNDLAQIRQVLRSNGVGCTDIKVLPRNLPTQCVTTQAGTNTGSTVNCPGQCYGAPNADSSVASYPNYNYNSPSYSYSPPSVGCGCSN